MKITFVILLTFLCLTIVTAQEAETTFNAALAKSLSADEYGMKEYVFCILKKGNNTTASKEERTKLLAGHMANINKLAKEGKLIVAGPFMENDRDYSGIFIFNVTTVDEARKLVESDPAVKAKLFEVELTPWYSTAALQQISKMHDQIAKIKF